jgi:hypothetical protein
MPVDEASHERLLEGARAAIKRTKEALAEKPDQDFRWNATERDRGRADPESET